TVDVLDVNEGPQALSLNNSERNLIRNGSFEDFDVAEGRWKGFQSDDTGSWQNANGMEIWNQLGRVEASEGNQLLEMDHGHGVDSISQVIQTEDGQLYDLSLDLRERVAGGTDTVEVYWNGNLVAELDPQSADWETFKLQVVGTGKDTLELRESQVENDSYGALIDNVTLTVAEQTVAENTSGAVVGQLSFDDPDLGDTHRFEVSDDRFEVIDNQLRLKPGVALDYEEASSLTVDVTVIDEGGLRLTESFTVNVADRAEMSFSTGFSAKYFDVDHRLSKLDDLDWSADPSHQEVISEINYTNGHDSFWEGGSKDTFGVEIKGNIEVEEGGTFTFFLGADDGATLIINGQPVVENDGVHGFRTRSGEIELEPGTHAIEIRYFENYGRAGLKLEWEGPGLDGRELVAAPELTEAQTVSGMPLTIDVDTGMLNLTDETNFKLGDLPPGTLVEAGGTTFEADETGTVELEGWRGGMLTLIPPPDFSGTVEASFRHSTPTGDNGSHYGVQTLTFKVNEVTVTPPSAKMVGGFHASYFDTDNRLTKLEDIDWTAEPTHQEFVAGINYVNSKDSFWEGGSKDTFGAKLEGQVTVEEGGSYRFFAGADDGVAVFINGDRIINNDGLHGFRTRSGEVDLEPGTYDIEVRYFENYGHAGLKLEWEGPGTEGREILQADPQPSISDTGTLEVAIELDQATDQAVVSLDGLPPGTLLISGEDSAIADSNPTDLSGWDLSYLEISPPPGFEGTIEGEIIVTDTGFNGAKTTSEVPFELGFGHDHNGADDLGSELADTLAATSSADTPPPWHLDQPSHESDQDGDVMAEAILTHSGPEISCIQTEAYERIDW
ncbi:PA14 domain-containing protein, partial [Ruegeria arenilitoris]|uniref:PA14 domain-containing protein n=1 Tax=Ruegeria arenilitoris TaxID=1173585 RepID=UPI00147FF1BF